MHLGRARLEVRTIGTLQHLQAMGWRRFPPRSDRGQSGPLGEPEKETGSQPQGRRPRGCGQSWQPSTWEVGVSRGVDHG